MTDWIALALVMVGVAAVLQAPGLILVAMVTLAYGTLTRLWTRFGIQRIEYERRLSTGRAVAGDDVALDVTIWNRKPLPLPWVAADDLVSEGLSVRERPELERAEERPTLEVLHNAWALTWYERVVRHFHLDAVRRGVYWFGPVHLRVRDILGRDAVNEEQEQPGTLIVGPRTVPIQRGRAETAPIGDRRARQSLHRDPALYGGVRPFQPGDSRRHVHWRATARLGTTVSRRFEPARGREVVIAIDVQTIEGPDWAMNWDDEAFESMCVVAASLARRLLAGGASVGLAAASFTGSPQRQAWLAPQSAPGQVARVETLLARIGPVTSGPFGALLTWLTHRLAPGTTVVVITARDPRVHLPPLRRMRRSGYSVELITIGQDRAAHAQVARSAGLPSQSAEVRPNAEIAETIVLGG
jgi:uncharacterized protein (DUF58 family)